jgi:sugar transferase (PEP-CTERM/EpsH1 system associated)
VRILYLCHRIPFPPDKGDKIRAFHQLRALSSRHEVDLFTLADDPADLGRREALLDFCRSVTVVPLYPRMARLRSLPHLFTSAPLTIPYFASETLQDAVHGAFAERSYDRIFVYCSAMAQYVENVVGIPVLTDLVDVDSDKWSQYATFKRLPLSAVYRREANALRRYERSVCKRSTSVIVTTDREAALLREIVPSAVVDVIPNGVDTEYFSHAAVRTNPGAPTVGFTGDMSYFPNQEAVIYFAHQVLPVIRQSVPDARFLVVGRNPNRKVQALAEMEGVEVTGFVPDVRTHLARMTVSVAPFSIAAGIQNKIIEAMSYQLPVVATSRTVQGLTPAVARAVEVADAPGEMAAGIVRLLQNPEFAAEKGAEGRCRVTADYNWERSLERLLELVESPVNAGIARAATTPLQ